MIKIIFIIGTRPDAIKMAPVIHKFQEKKDIFHTIIITTNQHNELLTKPLRIFNIKPDYNLHIMRTNQTLVSITSMVINKLDTVLKKEKPDLLLVQGDTTTALSATLCAFYNNIAVGHIEAGLRTGKKYNPFPEEINRKLISAIADLHFAPTKSAYMNLVKENINKENIVITGNTIIDTLFLAINIKSNFQKIQINTNKKNVLITLHRRESFGKPLENILLAIKKIATGNKHVDIYFPVHPNPNVINAVNKCKLNLPNITLLRPLSYLTFINLMSKMDIVLTDSGGIQEEAPSLGVPVLVAREETERPEGVKAGCSKIVGTNTKDIVNQIHTLLNNTAYYKKMSKVKNPYGDGKASERITDFVEKYFDRTA